jgi:hypothetical protein
MEMDNIPGKSAARKSALIIPAVAAIACFVSLALFPQIQEIYRQQVQNVLLWDDAFWPKFQLGASLFSTALLSIVLFIEFWIAYVREADIFGPRLARILACTIAAFPLLGFALGLWLARTPDPSPDVSTAVLHALAKMFEGAGEDALLLIKKTLFAYNRSLAIGSVTLGLLAVAVGSALYFMQPLETQSARIANAIVVLPPIVITTFTLMPVELGRAIGPVSIIMLFMITLIIAIRVLNVFARRIGWPVVSTLLISAVIFSAFDFNDNHLMNRALGPTQVASSPKNEAVGDAFIEWVGSRPDLEAFRQRGDKYPVFIVAAQGGGIYAAVHTASLLGALQDQCPSFFHHTFAISGVSGGSVGATVLLSLAATKQGHASTGCIGAPLTYEDSLVHRTDLVLSEDLLSPLLSGLLFTDFMQRFIPFPVSHLDRSRLIENALENSIANVAAKATVASPQQLNLINEPYGAHWVPQSLYPALVINTTDVGGGNRRLFSPFKLDAPDILAAPEPICDSKGGLRSSSELKLSAVAFLSARFPWVTPPGGFLVPDQDGRCRLKVRVVDGGYFENSGLTTALNIYKEIEIAAKQRGIADAIDIRLITLTRGEPPTLTYTGFDELVAPITTLQSIRVSRAFTSLAEAERDLRSNLGPDAPPKLYNIRLKDMDYPPPLGWSLSPITILLIQAQNEDTRDCDKNRPKGPLSPCVFSDIQHLLQR